MSHYSTFAILLLLFTYAKSNMRKVFKCLDLHCGGEPGNQVQFYDQRSPCNKIFVPEPSLMILLLEAVIDEAPDF